MQPIDLILYLGLGIIVSIVVFYSVIRSAVETKKRLEIEDKKVKLLAAIAAKLGVEKTEIEGILK